MKSAIITALIVLSIIALRVPRLSAQTDQDKFVWGTALNGLQISLSLDTSTLLPSLLPPHLPGLNLALRNIGSEELHVELSGWHCGPQPGQPHPRQWTDNIGLLLTDADGNSKFFRFSYQEWFCAGALGQNVAILAPGDLHIVPVDLPFYSFEPKPTADWPTLDILRNPLFYEFSPIPGDLYTLQAEIDGSNVTGRLPQATRLSGPVMSNKLEVRFIDSSMPQ